MLGKTEGRRRRGQEDEMAGWHHRCDGHELGTIPRDGEVQGGLVCCSPWGPKETDMTGQLNNEQQTIHRQYTNTHVHAEEY